jgi:hypothetical protein
MEGRAFLNVARELVNGPNEEHWRSSAGRSYYALMLQGQAVLERWGFPAPPRNQVHAFVRLRFLYCSDPALHEVGKALDRLGQLRNQADYQLSQAGPFLNSTRAGQALQTAELNVDRLDQVKADPARVAAAIADIQAKWP